MSAERCGPAPGTIPPTFQLLRTDKYLCHTSRTMRLTDCAFMFGQYALTIPFWIDPVVLGVPIAPVAMVMIAAGAISAGGLLGAKYHGQMLAVGARMVGHGLSRDLGRDDILKCVKRNVRMRRMPASMSELVSNAPPGIIIAAGAFVLGVGITFLSASDTSDGGVTLDSWALHVGVWECVVGVLGIVWGMWRWCNPNPALFHRSRSGKDTRRRLSRVATHAFLDEQQVFVAPCSGRIKGLHGRR